MQLWGRAVTEAGTTDAKAVVKVMETYKDQPTILGPRSFSHELHIQAQVPMLVEEVSGGQDHVIDNWSISEAVPNDVLYRMKK